MKILSRLNSQLRVIVVLIILLIIAMLFNYDQSETNSVITSYHQSKWNEYSPEVDRAFNQNIKNDFDNLVHIYGGVVSHHIPQTIPNLVDYYSKLAQNQKVKNIIIVGPDHNDAGKSPITMSRANFLTSFADLSSANDIAEKIRATGLVNVEEVPFEYEHSIGSQILVISKILPDTRVVPIIVRSDTSREQALSLGRKISELLDEETVLIASIDFSHYLTTKQAIPIDKISGEIIKNLDIDSLSLMKVDSKGSAIIFIEAMKLKRAVDTEDIQVLNTNDLMQNSDYTTGYVFGYWGVK